MLHATLLKAPPSCGAFLWGSVKVYERLIKALLGLCMLDMAGCSRIAQIEETVAFAERAERINDQRLRVVGDVALGIPGLPGTAFEAIPSSGSATYLGSAFLVIQSETLQTDALVLVGDSTLTIDFATPQDAVTGGVDDIRLVRPDAISLDVPGQLVLDNGVIGNGAQNDLAFDVNGTVTARGTAFGLSGRAEGKLRGTRTQPKAGESPVLAYEVVDSDVAVTAAQGGYTATVTIIGEN